MVSAAAVLLVALAALAPVSAHWSNHTILARAANGGAMMIPLGRAGEYELLGTTGITTGAQAVITGSVGIYPNSVASITIPGGLTGPYADGHYSSKAVIGQIWGPDGSGSDTKQAHADVQTAIANGQAQQSTDGVDHYPAEIQGLTFSPGVYEWSAAVTLGAVSPATLNGPAGSIFVLKMGTMTLSADAQLVLTGGVLANTVFWVATTSFTCPARAKFAGTVLAGSTATFGANAVMYGSVYAGTTITM
ncbi:hypothetical protein RQP46_004892 [Phenoliferia psychrophenolica]